MKLTPEGCQQRREHLLKNASADLIVIADPYHILYLCGYWVTPHHIGSRGTPFLLIDTSSGKTTLLTHNFAPVGDNHYADSVEKWHWYDGRTISAPPLYSARFDALESLLSKYTGRTIGIEKGTLPHGLSLQKTVDVTPILLEHRRKKYPDERSMIEFALEAVTAGHTAGRGAIQAGNSELQVYQAIHDASSNQAGVPIHLLGDFVSGKRVTGIGGDPTDRVLQPEDVMILDIFPVIGGYRADFTATVAVSDAVDPIYHEIDTALHHAISAGEGQLRAGNSSKSVYDAVKSALGEFGLADNFPHHAGHGLGLGHPEAPYFVENSTDTLAEGDIVTLEPGVYSDTFGARIEHNYLITDDGFTRLTHHNTSIFG